MGRPLGDIGALADVNGDQCPDLVTADEATLRIRLNDGTGNFGSEALLPLVERAYTIAVADFTGDSVADIALQANGSSAISLWQLPGPGLWSQVLTSMPAPRLPIAGADTRTSTHQAMQYIDRLAVRVRIEGANLQNLRLRLRTPKGQEVALDNGGAARANQTVWQAHYPTTLAATNLSNLHGWQPEGDWTLIVTQAGAGAQAELVDFAVITHGSFVRASP